MEPRLIVGTTNEAKVKHVQAALASLKLVIEGLPQDRSYPVIDENSRFAAQNARAKALAYAQVLGEMVVSMDNALYFDGLSEDLQPGLHVRRIPGRTDRPSDQELIEYYSNLISGLGGKANGHWEFAICVAGPGKVIGEAVIKSTSRVFVSQPCQTVVAGYPLESLQIDQATGKYTAELRQENFWQGPTGGKICDFIKSLNLQAL